MKCNNIISLILAITVCLSSCMPSALHKSKNKQELAFHNDASLKWLKQMESDLPKVKTLIIKEMLANDYSVYKFTDKNKKVTKNDTSSFTYHPMLEYSIDSTSFFNINTNTDVKNILTLEDTLGSFFIAIDSTIFTVAYPKYKGSNWINYGGSLRIQSRVADMLSEVIFKKHKPIYVIDIKGPYTRFAYEENGELISIWDDGKRPLKESLIEQRNTTLMMRHFHTN